MRVAHGLAEAAGFRPSALTIGKFDGVHAGHRHLMQRVIEVARERRLCPSVLTFDKHPACVLAPERAPRPLLSLEERCARIAEAGIEQILVLPFTEAVARMSPEEFAADCLRDALKARAVLVGENFRFGRQQSGNPETLKQLGQRFGFETILVDALQLRGRMVSTSEIRHALEAGNVSMAGRLLVRPFSVTGEVVRGQGIGSKQTVPTLNLNPGVEQLPADGVYITCTRAAGAKWKSITNVGMRPTFDGQARTIETFLLDPLAGAAPERITVEFLRRVRGERKFASAEELKGQIMRDVERAGTFFRRMG